MRYLYYTIYRLMLKIKTNDTPDWNAMFMLTILEGMNILTLELLIQRSGISQTTINDQVILFAIIPCLVLFAVNYFLYVKNVKEIALIYSAESQQRKTVGVLLLVVYAIVSFLLLFVVFNMKSHA